MPKESSSPVPVDYYLQAGFIFVAAEPTVISTVLGSCVSVSIYDRKRKTGGMNHFQLPHTKEKHKSTSRYGNVATSTLIHMMINSGSKMKHLEAQIFGGAFNPEISTKDMGQENVMAAKKILTQKQVLVVSEDVGGKKGRKIAFNTNTNEVAVLKVEKLRKGDWYPFENDR